MGLAGDAGYFESELVCFRLQRRAIGGAVGAVGRLHREFAQTLQIVADFAERAFGRLRQRDAVIGVARCLIQAANLRGHPLGDGEAGGVVSGAVDAQAGGKTLQGSCQGALRMIEVALGVQ